MNESMTERGASKAASAATGGRRRSRLRALEACLWAGAVLCLLPVVVTWAARTHINTDAVPQPAAVQAHATAAPDTPSGNGLPVPLPAELPTTLITEMDEWSPRRLGMFDRLRATLDPPVLALLELPAQGIRIPVFSGASEVHMTLGAGHLRDTAPLDGEGNIAITAHRDGTFRALKDVKIGDSVILSLANENRKFVVRTRRIVSPDRVDVLDPTPVTTLTLITCYPFWFVGSAPERFILQAELAEPAEAPRIPVQGATRAPAAGDNVRTPEKGGSTS